jgi:hypothetical protein
MMRENDTVSTHSSYPENSSSHLRFDPILLSGFIEFFTERPVCCEAYRTSNSDTPTSIFTSWLSRINSFQLDLKLTASKYNATPFLSIEGEAAESRTSSIKCL